MQKRYFTPLVCVATFVLVIAVLFWPVICGRATVVPFDLLHQLVLPYSAARADVRVHNHYLIDTLIEVYPAYHFFHQSIRKLEWPLWQPLDTAGYPTFAVASYAFASPVSLVTVVLPPLAGFNWRFILQFLLAGLTMYWLLHRWKLHPAACLMGALAYALNSQFLHNFWHVNMTVFAWVPAMIYFLDQALADRRPMHVAAAGLLCGVALVSGTLQTATMVVALIGFYSLGFWIVSRKARRFSTMLFVSAVVVTSGFALAAVQLLPAAELFVQDGMRRIQDVVQTGKWYDGLLGLAGVATFFLPHLWGSTETFDLFRVIRTWALYYQGYVGVAAVVLAIVAVCCRDDRRARILGLTALAIIAVLALVPPVRSLLYYRAYVIYAFAAAALSGLGMDCLLGGAARPTALVRRLLWGLLIGLAVVAVGLIAIQTVYSIWQQPLTEMTHRLVESRRHESFYGQESAWFQRRIVDFWRHYRLSNPLFAVPLISGAVTIGLVLALLRGRSIRGWATVVIALQAVDLLVVADRVVPRVDLTQYPPYPPTAETTLLQATATRIWRLRGPPPNVLADNIPNMYGVRSLNGCGSLLPPRLSDVLDETGNAQNARALGLGAVSHLLARKNQVLSAPGFDLVWDGAIRIYSNQFARPRAYWAERYVTVTNHQHCLAVMKSDAWRSDPVPVIETATASAGPPAAATNASVSIVAEAPTAVTLRVDTPVSGYVVLADTYYPGWEVTVDQQRRPLLRAHGAHRAVFVEPGQHEIVFRFRPASFRLGGLISACTFLAVLGLIVWDVRGRGTRNLSPCVGGGFAV